MASPRVTGTDAIGYLRVSSISQVKTDYDPEGLSIGTQRTACKLRAKEVGATYLDEAEFIDPGRSARSITKREEFLAMIEYIKAHPNVGYVIVYALSRFARNRYDDAIFMVALEEFGVKLISATERNLDDTPAGKAMHGMIAVFNQYQSDASGVDISHKMGQKVISKGGALIVAPIGYRNTRVYFEGSEIRAIGLDTERDRVPLVKECFSLYATGEYTVDSLTEEMIGRGLTMRATPTKPERPITRKAIALLLRNRFYLAEVKYKGQWYPGRHEPLIEKELFDRVQRVMDSHSGAGVRMRRLDHYLKGVFRCARCGSRMIYVIAKNEYEYFYCVGTKAGCDQPYVPAETLERELLNHYHLVKLNDEYRQDVTATVDDAVRDEQAARVAAQTRITKRLRELDGQEDRYLDLLGDPDWPQDKIKTKLAGVRTERTSLSGNLAALTNTLETGRRVLTDALALLSDPYALYRQLPDPERRLMTLTVFGESLRVNAMEIVGHSLRPPFDELTEVQARRQTRTKPQSYQRCQGQLRHRLTTGPQNDKDALPAEDVFDFDALTNAELLERALFNGQSSDKTEMVELRGLEPLTPTLPVWCATSCATAPDPN
jgi:site-specific DNA recombinase